MVSVLGSNVFVSLVRAHSRQHTIVPFITIILSASFALIRVACRSAELYMYCRLKLLLLKRIF